MDYVEAIESLASRINLLTKVLLDNGFKEDELITSSFDVSINTKYWRGEHIDSGYIASQTIKIVFDYDTETLLKILNNTSKSKADPNISISFTITKEQKIKLQHKLIQMSVNGAKKEAQLIVEVANYKITGIESIYYGVSENNFTSEGIFTIIEVPDEEELDLELSNFKAANLTFKDSALITFLISK